MVSTENVQTQMELCIEEIRNWTYRNMLKLNGDKTEFLLFSLDRKHNHSDIVEVIRIGSDTISAGGEAKNLGVVLDLDFTLNSHITVIWKSVNFQLYSINHIKKYLTSDALKTAIHSLVALKIDYCNSLLSDLPKYQTDRLQHLLNSAARIISGTRKYDYITPVLSCFTGSQLSGDSSSN